MGNPAAAMTNRLQRPPDFVRPEIGGPNPGIISKLIGGGINTGGGVNPAINNVAGNFRKAIGRSQKPNMQKAQRMNPPEVPTRKFY